MLQRLREWLVLLLIVGLPFHAFLVTVGTRVLVGPGHVPLPWLAGWKEMVLGMVILAAIVEVLIKFKIQNSKFKIDILDCLILSLFALGGLTSIFNFQFSIFNFALGAKYTLLPLLLFLVLRRVSWSERFSFCILHSAFCIGAVVAVYGILTLLLPGSFFTWLGYSDLHSLYLPDGPIAAFQQIEGMGIRRIQSTFSGPNQLGMWLLIPWSVAVVKSVRGQLLGYWVTGLLGTALLLTLSRAAWIGAVVIVGMLLITHYKLLTRWKLLGYSVIGLFGMVVIGTVLFPELFLRTASSREHWRRPIEAVRMIAAHPLGLGLGSAGPASNRTSDPCVFLEEGTDVSWAKDRPNLCVFSGDVQVQPADRACKCPFLPENWYLQVAVELGVVGFVLFVMLVVFLLRDLLQSTTWLTTPYSLLPFLGISVAALFLHAWEDSAVAYTVWVLLATVLPVPASRPIR